jgi:hypothetical protein
VPRQIAQVAQQAEIGGAGALGLVDNGAQRVEQFLDAVAAGAGLGRTGPGGILLFSRPGAENN